MKNLIYISALLLIFSCSNYKSKNPDKISVEEVEKATSPVSADQFLHPAANNEFLYAFKLYVIDGQIVKDSTSVKKVAGKYHKTQSRNDFQIAAVDVNGKDLIAHYVENVFTVRSCEEGENRGIEYIQNGWVEIYLPANKQIHRLKFIDNIGKSSQNLDVGELIKNIREDNQNDVEQEIDTIKIK